MVITIGERKELVMKKINNIPVWGEPLPEAVEQMQAVLNYEKAPNYVALMADHHIGYSVPVGGVVAYEKSINVNGVGFDIACGNKAVLLDCSLDDIKDNMYRNMNEIRKHISFGVGRKNNELVDHELFDDPVWSDIPLLASLKDKARSQLGTVGSGNHYVDVFTDELSRVWVGVHFGSRGLGHSIATHFVKAGGGKDGVHAEPVIFDEDSDLGQQYLACMGLAGRYAYAGRDWVCNRVAKILRGQILEEIHNHHNFAWKERHFNRDLWVIRKGATPAQPGQKGFVGGSMGDISVILEGVESETSKAALYSTIHGAGRAMGRTQAKGKTCRKTGKQLTQGLVDKGQHEDWMRKAGVEVRGGGLDESPLAYKRIQSVLEAHKDTIKILHTLRPIGVVMASENEYDPYKD
jgi:tRNA-splicing ligase RtcB (3'-phosphate/5'-hydroxy nucleic acid ligase)